MGVARVSHIGLCVRDLERALRFYRDGLGFEEEHRLEVEGAHTDQLLRLQGTQLRAIYLLRDGLRLELLHFAAPPAPDVAHVRVMHEPGLTHLSFRVTDLTATLVALRAAGAEILDDTVLSFPEWQSGAAFVRDPDGQLIELVEAPGDPSKPPGVA